MNTLNMCAAILILCGFLFIVPVPSDGLTCWTCTNKFNSKCAEDSISGDESITMLKMDCSFAFRTGPASCSKSVIKTKDEVVVARGCIARGEGGIEDGKCFYTDVQSAGSAKTCLCQGDLCNGAATSGLLHLLGFLTFGLIFITIL